jgi:hypothetical protein
MKIVMTCCIALMMMGCKSKKNSMPDEITNSQDGEEMITITAEIGDIDKKSDLIEITYARIIENTLYLDVAYSGGCKKHDIQLVGSASIMKSLPPIRSIKLIHNSNNDSCREHITKTLAVDIRELAYQKEKGSVIYLTLDGWKERLTYTFE